MAALSVAPEPEPEAEPEASHVPRTGQGIVAVVLYEYEVISMTDSYLSMDEANIIFRQPKIMR